MTERDLLRRWVEWYDEGAKLYGETQEHLSAVPDDPLPTDEEEPDKPDSSVSVAVTDGLEWRLVGTVRDWDGPLVFPPMQFSGTLRSVSMEMEVEVGPDFKGLHNFVQLSKDAGKWKGDVILLLNRGGNGALAASHTLAGPESDPVRERMPLKAGELVQLSLRMTDGRWDVVVSSVDFTLSLSGPPVTVKRSLTLQLGNHTGDPLHPVNAGWRLTRFSGSVSGMLDL